MNIIKFIFIAFLAINITSCKSSTEKKDTTSTVVDLPTKLATANINIEGMTCEIGCAKTIESKLSKLEGITVSKVDFETKTGTFTYDSNKISQEKIVTTIDNLLDGKTYKANAKTPCEPSCEKPCCKTGDKKTCDMSKKECKPDCEKTCCKTGDKKTCDISKKGCKPGCEKPCCKTADKKTCDMSKTECKLGSEKPCCKTEDKKECKPDCKEACCATKK